MADDLDFGATIRGMIPGQKVFGRYTLTKILGRGGMGLVWLAHDGKLERDVALKFLPELVALDARAVDDLKRETKRALDLTHSHIVRIYDFVDDARSAAIAMEWIDGPALSALALERPDRVFAAAELEPWVKQLCEALTYAHEKARVVHRDLKPANLMIDRAGDLKVTDFGISATLSDSTTRVSKAVGTSGTPLYMSPQQLMGEKPAVSDDIYALGATLYELLTGKAPFYSGAIEMQVLNKVPSSMKDRRTELEVKGGGEIPPAWEATIAACLAKDPAERPQSAAEVWDRLEGRDGHKKAQKTQKEEKVGRHVPMPPSVGASLADARDGERARSSRAPTMAALAAGIVLLVAAGWYFGLHAPEQRRIEAERMAERQAVLEQERAAQERLANARGGIVINTTPSGADVTVGGFARERSPATLREVRLGSYPAVARLEGYEDVSATVEVKENEFATLNLSLTRSTGDLQVASNPPGLEVTVAGRNVPGPPAPRTVRTPTKLEGLPTGEYTLTYRRADWPEQVQTVRVERRATASALAEFVGGGLQVTSQPRGAEVWSQGRRLGTTPVTFNDLPPGNFEFEFRLANHRSATRSGRVVARETTRVEASLEEIRGPQPGQRLTIPDMGMELLPIAAGSFQMGTASGGDNDERPVTRVTISRPFWMAKTEVTQRQWHAVMGNNPSHFKGDNLPVEQVSWNEAMEYCRKLTERERAAGRLPEGYAYTLPTEAQWEYAARAGTAGDYGGTGRLDDMGWYDGNSGRTTKPVGTKGANAWGLHDMHGNVWEWCLDWYGTYPGGSVTDPMGAASGSGRVDRGGGWNGAAVSCRSAGRGGNTPGDRFSLLGFRPALSSVR